MTRRFKALGALFIAALALGAIQVSAASAVPLFHTEQAHTIGTASLEGNIVFTTPAGTVTCKKVSGSGTTTEKTSTEITTASVAYSECITKTIFGEISVTINMNGCHYLITADIEAHMICPEGKSMQISGPGCTISVRAQSATSIEYVNVGSGSTREVIASEQGTNIHSVATGFFCSSTGTSTTGTAVGKVRTKGENTLGQQVGIWWTDE